MDIRHWSSPRGTPKRTGRALGTPPPPPVLLPGWARGLCGPQSVPGGWSEGCSVAGLGTGCPGCNVFPEPPRKRNGHRLWEHCMCGCVCTLTCTLTLTRTRMHAHMLTCTHTHMHCQTHTYAHSHACSHTHSHAHCTQTHVLSRGTAGRGDMEQVHPPIPPNYLPITLKEKRLFHVSCVWPVWK